MAKPALGKKSAKTNATKGTKRRTKASKDPDKPKSAISAFMQFSASERQKVRDENPEAKITEISKILGELWRNMDEDEKAPFIKKATLDKERYAKEMAAYTAKKNAENNEDDEDDED